MSHLYLHFMIHNYSDSAMYLQVGFELDRLRIYNETTQLEKTESLYEQSAHCGSELTHSCFDSGSQSHFACNESHKHYRELLNDFCSIE